MTFPLKSTPTTDIEPLYKIPTYTTRTNEWSYSYFDNLEEWKPFLLSLFKEPGKYDFSVAVAQEITKIGASFTRDKYFCPFTEGGREYRKYWDTEKEKCTAGVIYIDGDNTFYIVGSFYMWLNFLPIYNKEKSNFTFPDFYDGQYHVSLYEGLAKASYKHCVILKKRQFGMSYFHSAMLINKYWFETGATLKLMGSLDSYINEEGTWSFLQEYRDFLNLHTAWYRPSEPDKVKSWQQRIQVEVAGRKTYRGRKNRLLGISTQQSPTKGVGGPALLTIYEESGIAPTMDKTYLYMKPALEFGLITTGMFITYGSVGDLHHCNPLKKFMMYAQENGFYAVETNLVDEKGTIAKMGLFIPEQWNMAPFIDDAGNSQVEEALAALLEKRVELKKLLTPEDYQLEVSQHPINIAEAFAFRSEAVFPIHHVSQQIKRIEDGEYGAQFIELAEEDGVIISKQSNKIPISEFPISKKLANKEGVLVVFERPDVKPAWGTYTASIDPVAEGRTLTSDSLCSIIVYKNPVVRIKHTMDGLRKPTMEGDKIVATWCGRYDDIKKTHRQLELIIRWYNAWTLCEANVSLFINHMIAINKQHFLVQKDQILFLKELSGNNGFHEYGWKNTGTMFKTNLLSYGVEYLSEEIDSEQDMEGNTTRIKYGVERIPDIMILKEMKEYRAGLNVDRLVAYCALIAFVRIQYASRGVVEIHEYDKKLENPYKSVKLLVTPFRNMGGSQSNLLPQYRQQRSAFRNYR